jgi:hypothetical protein
MAKIGEIDDRSRAPWAIPVALTALAIGLGVWLSRMPREADAPAPATSAAEESAAPPPRCAEASKEPFVVGGEVPRSARADAASPGDPTEESDDPAPFAVEVGRGAAFDGGFAVGVRRDAEGAAVAMVATLRADGSGGVLVRLGRSRGDLEAPVVAGAGASVLAVVTEPNASRRALKVAKLTGSDVTWGPELTEGRDDSLAVALASAGTRAVLAWDDLSGTGESARSVVNLASFDVASMGDVKPRRSVSSKDVDASTPRLTTRPGGYWLAYLVHGEQDARKRPKKPTSDDGDEDEHQGEAILASWIEVLPLDESGAPTGSPRAVSPKGGHVLSFDLAPAQNGNALVAWRDDDAPSGSSGGKVSAALVRLGGGGEPHVLVDHAGGAGGPDLLPGWISISSVNGPTRVAALSSEGELLDELAPEPSLGAGEPVAAAQEAILWARPAGKAMRLSVVRCRPRPAPPTADGQAADGSFRGEVP